MKKVFLFYGIIINLKKIFFFICRKTRDELLITCVIPFLNYSLFSLYVNLNLNTHAIDNNHARQVSDKERCVRIINVE